MKRVLLIATAALALATCGMANADDRKSHPFDDRELDRDQDEFRRFDHRQFDFDRDDFRRFDPWRFDRDQDELPRFDPAQVERYCFLQGHRQGVVQ